MKQFVERDGPVEGEACAICVIPKFSEIGGSYIFFATGNCLNLEQIQKAQGADLPSPSPDYNPPATAEMGVCAREALNWSNWGISWDWDVSADPTTEVLFFFTKKVQQGQEQHEQLHCALSKGSAAAFSLRMKNCCECAD